MRGTGLRHISLKTRDLKKTERFYTEVLGLEVAFRAPPKRIFFRSPKSDDLLDFVKSTTGARPSQGLDHFGFQVSKRSLKKLEARLKEHKVEIEGRRGEESVYFRDPNGYWVEFYCD
jgi:catechol 2,3-dioxygenase-like lactoylglutathione lyase family enzyme